MQRPLLEESAQCSVRVCLFCHTLSTVLTLHVNFGFLLLSTEAMSSFSVRVINSVQRRRKKRRRREKKGKRIIKKRPLHPLTFTFI